MAPPPALPKSILKKRLRPEIEADEVEEVPMAGPVVEKTAVPVEPESEEDDESEEQDSDEFDAGSDGDEGEEEEEDDDDEDDILEMTDGKARPVKKLKHTTLRPTPAPTFSLALNHLLSLPPTKSNPKPKNAPPSANTQRLERRARGLIRETKASHLARGHVKDVIGGWGSRPTLPFSQWDSKSARDFERARNGGHLESDETGAEREKRLRRLAQRGVVRLFNAIAAAQGAPEKAEKMEAKRLKLEGASDAASTATTTLGEGGASGKVLRRPNVLGGRGKGEALSNLSKASFLDLIRAGTTTTA